MMSILRKRASCELEKVTANKKGCLPCSQRCTVRERLDEQFYRGTVVREVFRTSGNSKEHVGKSNLADIRWAQVARNN